MPSDPHLRPPEAVLTTASVCGSTRTEEDRRKRFVSLARALAEEMQLLRLPPNTLVHHQNTFVNSSAREPHRMSPEQRSTAPSHTRTPFPQRGMKWKSAVNADKEAEVPGSAVSTSALRGGPKKRQRLHRQQPMLPPHSMTPAALDVAPTYVSQGRVRAPVLMGSFTSAIATVPPASPVPLSTPSDTPPTSGNTETTFSLGNPAATHLCLSLSLGKLYDRVESAMPELLKMVMDDENNKAREMTAKVKSTTDTSQPAFSHRLENEEGFELSHPVAPAADRRAAPGLWKRVVKDYLGMELFQYRGTHYLEYPSLACHILPADKRCSHRAKEHVIASDAYVGQLLWDKYLRWEYLLPACLKIIGDCIQDRSVVYGVPPFLHGSELMCHSTGTAEDMVETPPEQQPPQQSTPLPSSASASASSPDVMESFVLHSVYAPPEPPQHSSSPPPPHAPTASTEEAKAPCGATGKLKMFQMDKEICVSLAAISPIFTAVAHAHLRTVVHGIVSHVLLNPVEHGPPAAFLHNAESHPSNGIGKRKLSLPTWKPFTGTHTSHRTNEYRAAGLQDGYWVCGGYGYTCPTLVAALQKKSSVDHHFVRVKNLHYLYSWWRKHSLPEDGERAPVPMRRSGSPDRAAELSSPTDTSAPESTARH